MPTARGKPRSCARFRASCDSTSKTITLGGVDIAKAPSHDVANVEIAHIREGRNLRPEMTVEEHDSQCRSAPRPADARRSVRAFSARERAARADRGLMSLPELLMLDKPSLGLAPIIVGELFESSRATNARGVARKRRDSESVSGPLARDSCDRHGCALTRRCSANARAVASAAASRASSVVVVTRTPGAAALR